MKPRNVVEFSYGLKASAIQFFNDVEKYINLMITDLQEKCIFDSYCKTAFNNIRSEVKFMKSLIIQDTENTIGSGYHPKVHIDVIEMMWDGIGTLLFDNYFTDLDDKVGVYMDHIRRSYIEFINSCKINAEIEEED